VIFTPLKLPGTFAIELEQKSDERGFLARCWCDQEFRSQGIALSLAQASTALSYARGTLRGLHYQAAPYEEDKLIRCTRGAAYVVVADPRRGSPTWGKWLAVELTADNRRMIFIPKGYAQGYQTLKDDTELFYQMSQVYVPEAARGIRYDDPSFAIAWPMQATSISERDRNWPDLESKLVVHSGP